MTLLKIAQLVIGLHVVFICFFLFFTKYPRFITHLRLRRLAKKWQLNSHGKAVFEGVVGSVKVAIEPKQLTLSYVSGASIEQWSLLMALHPLEISEPFDYLGNTTPTQLIWPQAMKVDWVEAAVSWVDALLGKSLPQHCIDGLETRDTEKILQSCALANSLPPDMDLVTHICRLHPQMDGIQQKAVEGVLENHVLTLPKDSEHLPKLMHRFQSDEITAEERLFLGKLLLRQDALKDTFFSLWKDGQLGEAMVEALLIHCCDDTHFHSQILSMWTKHHLPVQVQAKAVSQIKEDEAFLTLWSEQKLTSVDAQKVLIQRISHQNLQSLLHMLLSMAFSTDLNESLASRMNRDYFQIYMALIAEGRLKNCASQILRDAKGWLSDQDVLMLWKKGMIPQSQEQMFVCQMEPATYDTLLHFWETDLLKSDLAQLDLLDRLTMDEPIQQRLSQLFIQRRFATLRVAEKVAQVLDQERVLKMLEEWALTGEKHWRQAPQILIEVIKDADLDFSSFEQRLISGVITDDEVRYRLVQIYPSAAIDAWMQENMEYFEYPPLWMTAYLRSEDPDLKLLKKKMREHNFLLMYKQLLTFEPQGREACLTILAEGKEGLSIQLAMIDMMAPHKDAIPALIQLDHVSRRRQIKSAILQAMGNYDDPETLAYFLRDLDGASDARFTSAIQTVKRHGTLEHVVFLHEAMEKSMGSRKESIKRAIKHLQQTVDIKDRGLLTLKEESMEGTLALNNDPQV